MSTTQEQRSIFPLISINEKDKKNKKDEKDKKDEKEEKEEKEEKDQKDEKNEKDKKTKRGWGHGGASQLLIDCSMIYRPWMIVHVRCCIHLR